jgi:hypothetical protein
MIVSATTAAWLLSAAATASTGTPGDASGGDPAPAGTTPPLLQAAPQPVVASARVDKAVATTGDVITYSVVIEHDQEFEIELPEPGADIAGLRIIDIGRDEPAERDGKVVDRRWYQLRADLVGTYILPPLRARYRRTGASEWQALTTSQIFLEVKSVLPADGEVTDIRDVKPLIVTDRGLPAWVLAAMAGGMTLVLALVALLWWRRRQRPVSVPPPPAYEVAFAALDSLRQTDFSDLEAVRDYYFRISEILRAYIEGAFSLNATDLTTDEILPRLVSLEGLAEAQRHDLREFLRHTDEVKFAERRPSAGEIEHAYEHALSFVEATAPPVETGENG